MDCKSGERGERDRMVKRKGKREHWERLDKYLWHACPKFIGFIYFFVSLYFLFLFPAGTYVLQVGMFLYYFSSCFKEFFMGHGVSGRCGQVVLNSSDIVSLPFVLLYIKIFLSLLSKKKKMQYILLG